MINQTQKRFSRSKSTSFVLKIITVCDGSYWSQRDNIITIALQVDATYFGQYPTRLREQQRADAVVASWRTRCGWHAVRLRARAKSVRYKVDCTAVHNGWTPARVVRSCPDRGFTKWRKWAVNITRINPHPSLRCDLHVYVIIIIIINTPRL